MKEIEVAYELEETIAKAQKKLKNLEYISEEKIIDTYFYDPSKKSSKPFRNNMGECLRIRSFNKEHLVEYKIDKFDDEGHWEASDKYGVKVNDIKSTLQKFNDSNLKELVSLKKHVFTYQNDNYIITLEDIENLGKFFEINYKKEINNEVSTIKDEMKEFVVTLGLDLGKQLKIGKPEMMLKKLDIHIK